MKWWKILLTLVILCLACGVAHAAPSVKRTQNIFTIIEAVNDDILAQVKAEMGEVDQQKLGFILDKITDDDLAKLCAAYPGMDALTIRNSTELTSIAPVAGLKGLHSINLTVENKVADFSPLSGLTEMLAVEVSGKEMGPDLKWMSGLTKLTRIRVEGGENLTSIEGIPSLPALRKIVIVGAAPADLSPLQALPALKELTLSYCNITDLSPLAKLPELDDLDLNCSTLKDFSPLAGCPKLRKVTYYGVKEADFSTLGALTQVQELGGGLTKLADISWVANLPNLKKFNVFAEYVTDYSPLGQAKVEDFTVWSMNSPSNDLTSLGAATSLLTLKLWSLDEVTGFEGLGGLVNLKKLIIQKVNEEEGVVDLAFLAKTSALEEIELSGSNFVNFETIAKCVKLRSVKLDDVAGVTSLAALKQLPELSSVTVSKDVFSEAELSGFGEKVKINQR